jgi:hypothetical protein
MDVVMSNVNKSQISTKEAEQLLSEGWKLKQYKDTHLLHSYYIANKNGNAKYINKQISDTLQQKGFDSQLITKKGK